MIIGVRAHDFGMTSPEELARRISAKGFTCIQLALAKAIAGIDPDRLGPGLARHIGGAFAARGISTAVLGCYINLIHPDPAERSRLLGRFQEHLRLARDFGTDLVGSETGSVNADYSYNPANHGEEALRNLVDNVAELAAEAEKLGVFVGIEGVATHTVHNPARMKQVLDRVGSDNLRVIFDPCNWITAENWSEQGSMIQASFDLFGERISAVHAKDFVIEGGGKRLVPVGLGRLDHALLLGLIKRFKPDVRVLLEDAEPETMPESTAYLRRLYEEV